MQSIKADVIYTGDRVLKNACVNFTGDKIVSLTAKPAAEVVGEYKCMTPAFIDAHCHIGMCRSGEPSNEDEANEKLDTIMALADALDSVQMDDESFNESVESGFLYSCVVPGSGNIIGGRSAVIRNYASDTNSAFICRAGMKGAFGYNPMSTREWKGTRPWTRMGCLSILRTEFLDILNKSKGGKKEIEKLSPKQKALKELLDGKNRLRVHVHKSDDIAALLRFVDEFKLKVTVEHAGDVHDFATFAELAKRKIPVIYGPMDCFAYKVELKHQDWRNIKFLVDSGVKFGLMSDHPVIQQGSLFLVLRHFLRIGLSKQQALALLTKANAEILGIDKFLGTLEKGKWASFVCWNGDPFELTSYPLATFAEGKIVYKSYE
ncbi:MAG TPA: imidazolonepropionase [Lentisphaeria bacterium]|nr:MAG: imidazolonepropionase [Lentisphaerae bacterium GWF2_49_21]HBC85899.1 imidazolonepropionase [Lentisphaeria bacterium]